MKIGDVHIEVVSKFKYLGLFLDSELMFNDHVEFLKRKLIGCLKMLGSLTPLIGQNLSISLFKTLIIHVLDYVDIVYDCLNAKKCAEILKLQNYAMWIISQTGFDMSTVVMHCKKELQRLSG